MYVNLLSLNLYKYYKAVLSIINDTIIINRTFCYLKCTYTSLLYEE